MLSELALQVNWLQLLTPELNCVVHHAIFLSTTVIFVYSVKIFSCPCFFCLYYTISLLRGI